MTGSTTKAFTAAAAALLVHDNKNYPEVQWTSPINNFIRADFVLENDYATAHTTIEDAIVHRTGLPRHDLVHGQRNDTPASVVRKLRYLPLTAEPRQKFQYCPLMYGVLSHLLETITGRSLAALLEHSLWKPLGMLSTTFTLPDNISDLARGYWWHEREERYIPEPYDNVASISGSGAIFSTVNDYALWIRALLEPTTADDASSGKKNSPLTNNIVRDLFTPRTITDDFRSEYDPLLYALGWETTTVFGETIVAHGGAETGFGTEVYMLPGQNYGIVTMANTESTGNMAGAVIAEKLLLGKLNRSADAHKEECESIAKLVQKNKAVRRSSKSIKSGPLSTSRPGVSSHTEVLPLPWPIADLAGSYSHPAYGTINLTLSHTTTSSHRADIKTIETVFYPRTWPLKLQFCHISSTVFGVRFFEPHGLGDVMTGEGIVWEGYSDDEDDDDDDEFRAIFEVGLDGEKVERVGIELEESVVAMARGIEGKRKGWRKGMVWFEKIHVLSL